MAVIHLMFEKRIFIVVVLLLVGGCARPPATGITSLKPANIAELNRYLLDHKADVDLFRLRGPFAVVTRKNRELSLSDSEHIVADLYLAAPSEKTGLVIFLHGYGNSKEDHAYQAMHVASWGMHCLVLQLPNKGPWVDNGKTLAKIVDLIYRQPEIIDRRVDTRKIVLVGHSFGGSSVAIAMAEGAPAAGGILLDPAGIGRNLPQFLGRVNKPVMLLGADEHISPTRNRDYFFYYIRRGIIEVSIKDAVHEDAQYPAELPLQLFSGDSSDTEELQITFVSGLTAAAFSLVATGGLGYAWDSLGDAIKAGRMFNAKKK